MPEERPPAVHPAAIVHPDAQLGSGVSIGPYAVVESGVVIGDGTTVGPHSVIHHDVTIGRRNHLGAHVVIGGRPQDRAYRGEPTRVVIGDDNVLSEFACIDRASGEGLETRIGNGAYIMSFAKISHNCSIGDGANIVGGVELGGWVSVGDHAYVGGVCGVHQFVHIGHMVMVAGLTGVSQDVPPYLMVRGIRARAVGLNRVGLQRHGVTPDDQRALRRAFRIFFQLGLSLDAAIEAIEVEEAGHVPVQHFLAFVRASRLRKRGIVRWALDPES